MPLLFPAYPQRGNRSNTKARTESLSSLARLRDPAMGQGQRMWLTSKGAVRSQGLEGQRRECDQASSVRKPRVQGGREKDCWMLQPH